MKNPEQLIADYLDDAMSASDDAELNAWLKADAANMQHFTETVMFEQQIRAAAQAKAQQQAASGFDQKAAPAKSRWLAWRPLTAAAAGIMFGMLCTSMVFGFVMQQQMRTQLLLSEGFEDVVMPLGRGVPYQMELWSGDLQVTNGAEGAIKPAEGLRMVALPPVEGKKFSYAFRFLDVSKLPPLGAAQTRQIEVIAQIYVTAPGMKDRLQIRLAAFAEDVAGAREIWVKNQLNEQALLHVSKTVKMEADAIGWTTVRSLIDVPAEAHVVLVSLAAGLANPETPTTPHYLDDVQIRLFTLESPQL